MAFFPFILGGIILFAFLANGGTSQATTAPAANTDLSSVVPPNFAAIFNEAAEYYHLNPAIIAAIYLTEHHTDSFGKDLPSLSYAEPTCTISFAGAVGPMQLTSGPWQAFAQNDAPKFNITNPNPCRYRDSILGGARYINREIFTGWAASCQTKNGYVVAWTDACIKEIGEHYCGACTGPACGTNGYNYCEQTLRHFNLVSAKTTFDFFRPITQEKSICYKIAK